MEFSTNIFKKSYFNNVKMIKFLENELKIHEKFCELVQIWLPDLYSKTPNTQMDTQNIMKSCIL